MAQQDQLTAPERAVRKSSTLATSVYGSLRTDIILATLRPAQKLKVAELSNAYGVGLAPVREALNRLSAEGLVTQSDQRGFAVAPISEASLDDLLKARCCLNELTLRESIKLGDSAWEEHVLVCAHRLLKIPRHVETTEPLRNPDWESAHLAFHRSILSACGSELLMGFCDQLFTEADRYRHIARSVGMARSASAKDEHQEIADATIARRADDAVRLLNAHYTRTAALVRRVISK